MALACLYYGACVANEQIRINLFALLVTEKQNCHESQSNLKAQQNLLLKNCIKIKIIWLTLVNIGKTFQMQYCNILPCKSILLYTFQVQLRQKSTSNMLASVSICFHLYSLYPFSSCNNVIYNIALGKIYIRVQKYQGFSFYGDTVQSILTLVLFQTV